MLQPSLSMYLSPELLHLWRDTSLEVQMLLAEGILMAWMGSHSTMETLNQTHYCGLMLLEWQMQKIIAVVHVPLCLVINREDATIMTITTATQLILVTVVSVFGTGVDPSGLEVDVQIPAPAVIHLTYHISVDQT